MNQRDPLKDLNPRQEEAVVSKGSHLLVKAGPGTGKTRVLTARILYLITEGVKSDRILAITFTNKAASEIKKRLEITGLKALPQVETFHSWAYRIISFKDRIPPYVIDEHEQKYLLKQAAREAKLDASSKELIKVLLLLKQQTEREPLDKDEKLKALWNGYHRLLKEYQLFDYDDLIIRAIKLLEEDHGLFPQYVLVDEFQDVNPIQFYLVRLLARKAFITAIGDPYQAIYGFRGANPEFIKRFETGFSPVKIVILSDAYRCPQKVLNAAASLFPETIPLKSKEKKEGEILHKCFDSSEKEASWIAMQIDKMVGGISFESMNRSDSCDFGNMALSDICILYRTRAQAAVLTMALTRQGIPFHTPVNHRKGESLALNMVQHLVGFMDGRAKEYHLRRLGLKEDDALRLVSLLEAVGQGSYQYADFLNALAMILGLDFSDEEVEGLKEAISLLKKGVPPSLVFKEEQDSLDFDVEAVSLMTIHGSKGLEFPVVFLSGVEKAILPWKDGDVEEERRLFYVGLTRCAHKLFITTCKKRCLYGSWIVTGPSPFLRPIEPYLTKEPIQRVKKKKNLRKNQKSLF